MYRRNAFTLLEVLVVIGIVAILMGILLPAVQKAREAANRTQCTNNLHQIAIAVHLYHDGMGSLPAGMRYQAGKDPYRGMTWLTQLLPYVDQQRLWDETVRAYQENSNPLTTPPHTGL